ncbi:MAG: TIGR03621 family F420-dependent LLM class oxidoreductase [Ilumatobacteraceae bacterium]
MTSRPRPFRFGLQSYAPESADAWRRQARRAEELGFSTFSVADHVIGPGPALKATAHPVQTVAAIPAMAVAAEATERIVIGSRVLCTDYRNPVMLAKELATLDFFSGGRLEIGLGAGWLENEYDAIGIAFEPAGVRIDRLEETIALLRASFAGGQLDQVGKHVHAVGFEAVPRPAGRPTLMIGGGSPRVLGLAGREADIVSLNFDNSSGRIGAEGVGSSTAELTERKIEWIRQGAGSRFDDIVIEIGAYFTVVTDDLSTVEKMAAMFGLAPDVFAEHPHALIGSVDAICDQLVARRERFGISYVTFGASVLEAVAPIVARLAGT